MKTELVHSNWDAIESDVLIIPLFEDENLEEGLPAELNRKLEGLLQEMKATEEWKGKAGQSTVIYRPAHLKAGRLVLLGAGKRADYKTDTIRRTTFRAMRKIKNYNMKRVAFYRRSEVSPERAAQSAVEGLVLATFDPDGYKTEGKSKTHLEEVLLASGEPLDRLKVEESMKRGQILGEATNLARSLINEPGNRVNPPFLAEKAREIAERYGLEVEVLGQPEMEKRGMNAILAVAQGSDEPARFIVLKHFGDPRSEASPVVFIGKGVTFDSGGLSLKPAQSMEEMKSDKAGGCAVLAAMQAIAELQIKKNVIGLIPAVENLPSGRAQRPGDVIRTMSGKTVEVINTDAEGRLIVADALHYARDFSPEFVIDLATLTGACIVALGHIRAGLFSNNDELCERLLQAAERSGEKLWRLPLDDEYRKELDSDIADLKNVGTRWGGAITAAKFLEEFVGDLPWCHIDMAGVDLFKEGQEPKGPTGFGVRTLVEMVST